jgi:16S rRNA (cytidine1402-2'-O)-methyltransferase
MGTLYLVATPIGNLEDMSLRAIRLLREARLIAAEDTRHTGKLLKHFEIDTPLTSYFEHNKFKKIEIVLSALAEGDAALVSDAGTPALNDPGYELVCAALEAGYAVIPIPGPSAPIAALVVSGLPTDSFLYLGYLPHKTNERRKYLERVAQYPYTLIFLESPYRILESLEDILSSLGDRRIAVAREMTKMFEQYWRGLISGALEYFKSQPARGEFVLVVEGCRDKDVGQWTEQKLNAAIRKGLKAGEGPSQLAARLAEESGWKRRDVYKRISA